MSEKKYCCVPETYKTLSIYNAGTIGRETIISEIEPSSKFKYCIDEFDKDIFLQSSGKCQLNRYRRLSQI